MTRFRRSPFSFFTIEKDQLLDVSALLRGKYDISEATKFFALSPLASRKRAIKLSDIEHILQIPDDKWVTAGDLVMDPGWLEEMSRYGLLLCDREESPFSDIKHRARVLDSQQWSPYSALYHFMVRGLENRMVTGKTLDYAALEVQSEERARQYVTQYGPPPDPFKTVDALTRVDLPLIEKQGSLYDSLRERKTIRAFDMAANMKTKDATTLLQYAFGCHGYWNLSPEVMAIHRTSPSGGGRHPIEVYPLVLRVDGLAAGLYHYDSRNHALELVREYDLDEARDVAVHIAGGQEHAGSAHMLFIMTAVFYRNHWKYRRRGRAYGVMLMDAAHLSQTFYLVATDLGLGAFYSAALDIPHTDSVLGLDGYEEGAIAICGCGVRASKGRPDHGLPFHPFVPRKTKLRSS